ncbi:MAG: hypothetical protein LBR11_09820 [Deltaproteobacteria bacterium]|nr:hypothetical protein [Deltaproteobacteria bacterium]
MARDAATVSGALRDFFSVLSYYQRPDNEKTFHLLIQSYLLGMGLKVQREVSGAIGRLDLSVELPGQVFLIIELKYRSKPDQKKTEKRNAYLASLAYKLLPAEMVSESLSNLAFNKLNGKQQAKIFFKINNKGLTNSEITQLFVQTALESLQEVDINAALASLVLAKLPPETLNQELLSLGVEIDLSSDSEDLTGGRIDQVLTKTAQLALRDITQKDYHGPFRLEAKEFIDLALVIYDHGSQVKAVFGQNTPKAKAPSP